MQLITVAALAIATSGFADAAPKFADFDVNPHAYGYGLNPCGYYGRRDCKPVNCWPRYCTPDPLFSNYANVLASNETVPMSITDPAQGLLEFNTTDTNDWSINSLNRTEVVAKNPGVWSINVGVQTTNNATNTYTDGDVAVQIYINGNMVSEMRSGVNWHSLNSYYNLATAQKVNIGDRLQIAVIIGRAVGAVYASSGQITLTKVPEPRFKFCKWSRYQ